MENIYGKPHDAQIHQAGKYTATKKAEYFKNQCFQGAVLAFKNKQFIGNECKNNRKKPGNDRAGNGTPVEKVIADPVGGDID